jgi:hypothetical protein
LATFDDATLIEMNRKAEKLQDFSQVDISGHLDLWKETLHVRRQYISSNSTSDVITKFPGYSFSLLVELCSFMLYAFLYPFYRFADL